MEHLKRIDDNYKNWVREHFGNAIVFTDLASDATDEHQLEEKELLPGELSAVMLTVGCYTIRSSQRIYKAQGNEYGQLEIPADKEALEYVKEKLACVKAEHKYENGVIIGVGISMFPLWHEKLRMTEEISAKHNSDHDGAFLHGFKYICRAGHDLNNHLWSHSISYICTMKKNPSLSDNDACLFVHMRHCYFTDTSNTLYSLSPQGVLVSHRI